MENRESFYAVDWVENCYKKIAVPNSSLEKLMKKINDKLASNVQTQFDKSTKQQALFAILGKQFVKEYFPHVRIDDKILNPPHMSPDIRLELMEEMKAWLTHQLRLIIHELGYDKDKPDPESDFDIFFQQVQKIYQDELGERVQQLKEQFSKRKNKSRVDFDPDSSNHALGEALLAVGLRDPFKMAQILKTLQLKCYPLPGKLRSYVWAEHLFFKEKIRGNIILNKNIVEDCQIRFKRVVYRNVNDMKLEGPTQSNMQTKIKNSVTDVYDHNYPLNNLDSSLHLLEAANVLNALNIYNGSFNPLFVIWLCPLQLSLDRVEDDEENCLNLAMYLELFIRHCPLTQSELFALADQVMDTLKNLDPYLHEHLGDVITKKINVSDRDFPTECLHQDRLEANKIANELSLLSGNEIPTNRVVVFQDPAIFVRKWLITVFVSTLSPFVFLLVWDYIFLGKWEKKKFHDFSIVLLGLLKHWFYRVKDFRGLKQVFFEEPSKLYTSDIRRAWLHYQEGGDFDSIPDMNSNLKLSLSITSPGDGVAIAEIESDQTVNIVKPKLHQQKLSTEESDEENVGASSNLYLGIRRQSTYFPEGIPAWVPFNSDNLKTLPIAEGIAEAFDLYIDSIRFMPDNTSVAKITGKIQHLDLGLSAEEKVFSPDIFTMTDLTTSYRNPEFHYRVTVNKFGRLVNPEAVLSLQVFTIDRTTKLLVLLGSTYFSLYDTTQKKPTLKFGGHQIRLRYGPPPSVKGSLTSLTDFENKNPPIPAASILIRILPQTLEFLDAPEYDTGYYMSESSRPTLSEWNLFRHYLLADDLLLTVRQVGLKILRDDRFVGRITDDELEEWIKLKLENKTKQTVKNINMSRFVNYSVRSGIRVQVKNVYNLPEYHDGHYIQALVRTLPGIKTKRQPATSEGWGVDEKFLTRQINLSSHMRSPSWNDHSNVLRPHFDEHATLLVELFGLEVVYQRDPTGIGYGMISSKSGSPLKINLDSPLAWSVIQLFNDKFVNAGLHICPLFKGKITTDLINKLQNFSASTVLRESVENEFIQLHDKSVIELSMWDGNFLDDECPTLQKSYELLEICGIHHNEQRNFTLPHAGKKLSWIVSSIFSSKELSSVTKREIYTREKELFQELILKKFTTLMNLALKKEGLKELVEK